MVDSTLVSSAMIIKYVSGVNSSGKDIIKSQSFNNIRNNMTDDDIVAVGKAIMSMIV